MTTHELRRAFLICLVILTSSSVYGQTIWHVDVRATRDNTGASWTDAFSDLQDALGVAHAGDEIWVAAGTYRPDRGTGDRTMSFNLVSGVGAYGGFAGWETAREQRDWSVNRTILSGDLLADDGPLNCAAESNCCIEHEGVGCDDPECNAIICPPDATPHWCCQLRNDPEQHWDQECIDLAEALCCGLGEHDTCDNALRVVRATACNNQTILDGFEIEAANYFNRGLPGPDQYGAGLLAEDSEMQVRNCVFQDNESYGAYILYGTISFSQSQFSRNYVGAYGGGGSAAFVDCAFRDNLDAGASLSGEIAFDRCESTQNGTYGFWFNEGRISIKNSTIGWNGSAWEIASDAVVTLLNCTIVEGSISVGFGGGVKAVNTRFSRARNYPAVALFASRGVFENCLFENGTNQASASSNNSVVYASGSPSEFRNCTFAHNMGVSQPSVISTLGSLGFSPVTLSNCVFWVGDEYDLEPDGLLKAYHSGASFTVDHSIIQGWSGALGGMGNSGLNPQFFDPDGADGIPGTEDDDFRLAPGSPGINAGDPGFDPLPGETDLDGHARVLCGAVDIGAYEFGAGDFNCDQAVDLRDHAAWRNCMTNPRPSAVRPGCESFDFNADSAIDLADYAYLQRMLVAP